VIVNKILFQTYLLNMVFYDFKRTKLRGIFATNNFINSAKLVVPGGSKQREHCN
jgi:hypothetical protein